MKNKRLKPLKSFYVFGDSICTGQRISIHDTWVTDLSLQLQNFFKDKFSITVQNASVNGNTTRQALERMSFDICANNSDFLMVQFGMNDCNYWNSGKGLPRVSQNSFMSNLEEIVLTAFKNNIKNVFVNTNHPSLLGPFEVKPSLKHSEMNATYNELIRKVFKKLYRSNKNLTLIDIEKLWKDYLIIYKRKRLSNFLMDDKIHLSKEGHKLYKDLVIPKIINNLKTFLY